MPLVRTVVVFLIVVLSSADLWAQAKTDVVTLANGDRFTGEIKELNRGRLELETDDAGTIEIEWENIVRVVSTHSFEIETSDGRRLLGSLGQTSDQVVLLVGTEGSVSLTMPEITRITPIGASFWSKIEGSVDAGFSYTRSSGVAQTTLNSDSLYRRPAFQFRLALSATLTQRSDVEDRDDRGTLSLSYFRYRGRRMFIAGTGSFETNESLGLALRSQVGGLVGLRYVNTNRAQLEVGAGVAVNEEQGVDTEPTENVEGILGFRSSFYTYDKPKTEFDISAQYYPSLSNWGRQRLQFDSSLKRDVWKDFFISFNVYDTFDSAPPNPDAERNDVGVVASFGLTY
jgi:hypothetical protein